MTSRKIHSSNPFRPKRTQPERTHSSRLVVIWSEIGKIVLFYQDNASSHKSTVAKLRIGLWIDSSFTLFFGFGPVWLLSVPKLKNSVGRNSRQMRKSLSPSMSILQTLRQPTSNDYQTWTMRPFWLKFGLKGFEEWIFRNVASSNGL